ncbi:MAG: C45 family autoproteolytic acyltransferase/hydrolase [Myxococcota bacterium]|nr:C45 family autoproteolytic acyltransferase/hydrolase [Myxococcota bacterium]
MKHSTPLAIVGVAGRFPGAPDRNVFWKNILRDHYAIKKMPSDRFHRERYFDPEIGAYGKSYCELGGLIDEVPFDTKYFRIPPKVLASTDIAQLWALQVALETIIDAGRTPEDLKGHHCGVFIGHARGSMLTSDMAFSTAVEGIIEQAKRLENCPSSIHRHEATVVDQIHGHYPKRTEDGGTGTIASALAGRITSTFEWTGPHMVIDAACASSFAALDMAARAIRSGRLPMALVGGASYSQELSVILFAQSRALSPNGTYPFDRRADGFISSDGVGFLLIMPLEKAIAEGYSVKAVIQGIGGSCDGKGKALWAPRKEGQVLAMQRAYQEANIDPASIGLIEAHATSTALGDATEIDSIQEVFGPHGFGPATLPIGSVKGNIGHCREAAGIAGLIKAISALEQKVIPPTGNFRDPNPEIPWDERCATVSTTPKEWEESTHPRRAGCNAFGIGGLNYHVIVEEATPQKSNFFSSTRSGVSKGTDSTPSSEENDDIAIVGMGLRVPSASDLESFWNLLATKKQVFQDVPKERWSSEVYFKEGDRETYRTYAKKGGFVTDFEANWRQYRVPPKLIERNDPLQFMLLESALDALTDANLDLTAEQRKNTGVFIGTVFGSDYALELSLSIRALELAEQFAECEGRPNDQKLILEIAEALRTKLPSINEDSSGSLSSSTLASRISKTLDLMGPTFSIDAACASSLASLDIACDYLRSGQLDHVLYGGGDRAMRIQRYEAYCQFHAITKQSFPRPFDENADGFLPGEGAGICVLKRHKDALKDGDKIYAIIRGIGSSSDGERKSLHKPSAVGLGRAMTRALDERDIEASKIQFVECHGGGTPSGDRTEITALNDVYASNAKETDLFVTTLKSNLGHTQGAAGALSIIKSALCLHHHEVPPVAGLKTAANFGEDKKSIRALQDMAQISNAPYPAYGAVSAMGLGGINYHVVLESGKVLENTKDEDLLYLVQDSTKNGLKQQISSLTAKELYSRRVIGQGAYRCVFTAESVEDLEQSISTAKKAAFLPRTRDFIARKGIFLDEHNSSGTHRTCFMFSGQGSQYLGMHRQLYELFPAVKALVERIDEWISDKELKLGYSRNLNRIYDVIHDKDVKLDEVFDVQASVLAGDLIAYTALSEVGILPDVVTGHSFGDYAALVSVESWTLETALEATWARAEAINRFVPKGAMLSVSATHAQVQNALKEKIKIIDCLEAGNINAPQQVVLSGDLQSIENAKEYFDSVGIETKKLPIPRAFHCSMMKAAEPFLTAALGSLEINAPNRPFLSSVTGKYETDSEKIREGLSRQLTLSVDYVSQIQQLSRDGVNTFIEAGPRGILSGLTRQTLKDTVDVDSCYVMSTDDGERPGRWAIGRLLAMKESQNNKKHGDNDEAVETHDTEISGLALFDEDEAQDIIQDPAFEEFWESTKPSISQLVRNLWDTYQTQRPSQNVSSPNNQDSDKAEEQTILPVPLKEEAVSKEEITDFLIEALCDETGYPPDIIELDADLEADLGIDTVKQAQVLGKVRDRFQIKADQSLSLSDFSTLRNILEFVVKQVADREPIQTPKFVVPMVDVTKRRSQTPSRQTTKEAQKEPQISHTRPSETSEPDSVSQLPSSTPHVTEFDPSPISIISQLDEPLDTSSAIPILKLSGNPFEMGVEHGETLRSEIQEMIERYENFLGERGLTMTSVPEAVREFPKLFDQRSLEEIRGIATGADLPVEYLVAYNLDNALFPAFTTGCTQAMRTSNSNEGNLLHITNEDSPLKLHLDGFAPRVVQIRTLVDQSHHALKTVHFSLAGQLSGPNAVNSKGITVSSCTLLDRPVTTGLPRGVPHPQIVKRIVEECSSLKEAVNLVKSIDRTGRWGLLISDADRDEAAYLEYDDDKILMEGRVPEAWVSSNHALSGSAVGESAPEHSTRRAERMAKLFVAQAEVTVANAKVILRDRYDSKRKRTVTHSTMNTVCRVDNVMSLIVESQKRQLHFTTYLNTTNSDVETDREFTTVDYSTDPIPEPIEEGGEAGQGLTEQNSDVMQRHVVRVMPDIRIQKNPGSFAPKTVLLIGEGSRAEALQQALEERGATVDCFTNCAEGLKHIESEGLLGKEYEAVGIIGFAAENRKSSCISPEDWQVRREQKLVGPFKLLQRYVPENKKPCVFAITVLGGALGFDNSVQGSPENGGLVGLLKAIRREYDDAQVQILDTSPSAAPAQVVKSLLAELDAGSPRLEVGLLRKSKIRLTMAPSRLLPGSRKNDKLPSSWLITGGARGVTSAISKRLAKLYSPDLFLLGRHKLPKTEELNRMLKMSESELLNEKQALLQTLKKEEDFQPKHWTYACELLDKSVEIGRNIEELETLGCKVHYFAVDVSDYSALSSALKTIRKLGGFEGVIHGAGYELAKPFEKKTKEIIERTLAKADGLVNLFNLTKDDSVGYFAAFSSVVGRFGGHGQTDYAVANEVVARFIGTARTANPGTQYTTFSWPAWSEVGMAARSSSKAFLEKTGQSFMSPEEGADHFVRELWAGFPEKEVVFCDELPALDLDGILPSKANLSQWYRLESLTQHKPLISKVIEFRSPNFIVVEREIHASEAFLSEHRMGAVPILPAVAGLEMMLETLSLTPGDWTLAEVKIEHPLKVKEGTSASVRVILEGENLRVVASARKPDGVMLEPERVHLRAKRVARKNLTHQEIPLFMGQSSPFPYPSKIDRTPGSKLMFHGDAFRCLEGVTENEYGGVAQLFVPPVEALVRGSLRDQWSINSALVDGCLQAAGLLGRIKYSLSALPIGFGRIDVHPRSIHSIGKRAWLDVVIKETTDSQLVSDLSLIGEEGPMVQIESYRSQVIKGVR